MASDSRANLASTSDPFIESLMDTDLYSMGAYFSDRNPELIDELIDRSLAIEDRGLRRFSEEEGVEIEEAFRTLLTGLAVRYYKSVTG
ncbi:MAG: hypothetical protein J0H98_08710 [Solirubrobacterales bacterium]|nr:hypothetical protein [Solirubrobacterales bacterium]